MYKKITIFSRRNFIKIFMINLVFCLNSAKIDINKISNLKKKIIKPRLVWVLDNQDI